MIESTSSFQPPQKTVRAEARPFDLIDLTRSERAGLINMLEFLRSCLPPPPRKPGEGDNGHFDFKRSSGVHWLAGGRGSGKTSLLLSLQWATTNPLQFLARARQQDAQHDPCGPEQAVSSVEDRVREAEAEDADIKRELLGLQESRAQIERTKPAIKRKKAILKQLDQKIEACETKLREATEKLRGTRVDLDRAKLSHDAQEVRRLLDEVAVHVVWLDTLDLEPLPKDTNLLVAMLVRLKQAVAHELGETQGQELASARHDPCGKDQLAVPPAAWTKLNQFIQEVAISWNGNVEQRASELDADSYGYEAVRAEKARMALMKLDGILDEVARAIECARPGQASPLFVLALDDADLAPHRLIELLQLLRKISVRRLVTIVLSDPDDPMLVLTDANYGEIVDLRGARPLDATERGDLEQRAAARATRALRKLLPPAQQSLLGPLEPEEAWELRPPDEGETLAEVFKGILLPCVPFSSVASGAKSKDGNQKTSAIEATYRMHTAPLESLADLLDLSSHLEEPLSVFTEAGKGILRGPYRVLIDLWYQAHRLRGQKPAARGQEGEAEFKALHHAWQKQLLRFVGRAYQDAVAEGALAPRARTAMRGLWNEQELELDAARVRAQSQTVGKSRAGKSSPVYSRHSQVMLAVELAGGADLTRRAEPKADKEAMIRIEDARVVGWFQVLHDVAFMCDFPVIAGSPAARHLAGPALVRMSTESPVGLVEWMTPGWDTFVDFALFFREWNAAYDGARHAWGQLQTEEQEHAGEHFVAFVACRWIAAVTGVTCEHRRPPARCRDRAHPLPWLADAKAFITTSKVNPDLTELYSRLAEWTAAELGRSYQELPLQARAGDAAEWKPRLAILLDPGLAIPAEVAKAYWCDKEWAQWWNKERAALLDRRNGTLEGLIERQRHLPADLEGKLADVLGKEIPVMSVENAVSRLWSTGLPERAFNPDHPHNQPSRLALPQEIRRKYNVWPEQQWKEMHEKIAKEQPETQEDTYQALYKAAAQGIDSAAELQKEGALGKLVEAGIEQEIAGTLIRLAEPLVAGELLAKKLAQAQAEADRDEQPTIAADVQAIVDKRLRDMFPGFVEAAGRALVDGKARGEEPDDDS